MIKIPELYSLIFTDSLVSNLAINFHREFALNSAKMFGGYNSVILLLISSSACLLACIINYIFGRMLFNIFGETTNIVNPNNNFFYVLLCASFIPIIGKFIVVLAGFRRLNWQKVFSICGVLKLCYYFFIIFI